MNFKLKLMVAAIAVMGLAACGPDVAPKASTAPAASAPAPVAAAPTQPAAETPAAPAAQPAAPAVQETAAAPAAEMKKEEGEKKAN